MKKKIWTVVGCFAMVLVVAATSVGITLAALQGQVSSTFNISYTAKNVKAAIVGWVETYVECRYVDKENYPSYSGDSTLCYIQPLTIGDQDYMEFTGNESGTLSKQFDPINLDFQIDSKVVKDMKEVILHDGTVTEDKFQMSNLIIDEQVCFTISLSVINLDGDSELPVQYNIHNFDKNGDVSNTELADWPDDDEFFEEDWPDWLPLDLTIPKSSETMTFSQYAVKLEQQLDAEDWNGEFPYFQTQGINSKYAYFLDGSASNECLAVMGAVITRSFPQEMYWYGLFTRVGNHINDASFSGDISLTLGTF